MDTSICKGQNPFYGDTVFPHGISRSGYFNKRESEELQEYGATLEGLLSGALAAENEEEVAFIKAIESNTESTLYCAKLWKKYTDSVKKSKSHHGFLVSEAKAKAQTVVSDDYVPAVTDELASAAMDY